MSLLWDLPDGPLVDLDAYAHDMKWQAIEERLPDHEGHDLTFGLHNVCKTCHLDLQSGTLVA